MNPCAFVDSQVFIALGGNIGGGEAVAEKFRGALEMFQAWRWVKDVRMSSIYRSAPVGPITDQLEFFNGVAVLKSRYEGMPEAMQILVDLLAAEYALGRTRPGPHQGPRKIDLDLLFVGTTLMTKEGPPALQIPHPQAVNRAFVLAPLEELCGGDAKIPGASSTISECLAREPARSQEIALAFQL